MWSKWTAPAAGETGAGRPVRFWFVMSDGRGGVSWIRAVGTPAPAP